MENIRKLGKSVLIASGAQLSGRLANVAIPMVVIAMAGATYQTDRFFFILAVSFYFYGVLANAITQATISLKISGTLALRTNQVVFCGLVVAIAVATAAWLWGQLLTTIPLPYIAAMGLLAGAGIANGLATGGWQARERHIVPGLSWALRLIPLGAWWLLDTQARHLDWLALGIGMADVFRCILMLSWRSPFTGHSAGLKLESLKALAPTYGMVIVAALISGLNPIIDRLIAGMGGAGSLSVLETGERIYQLLASLATIGIATALLPRLSRHAADNTLTQNWPHVFKFVIGWCLVWLFIGGSAGLLGLKWSLVHATELTTAQSDTALWVYWSYLAGLPFFALALVYVKRLQALRHWRVMVLTSSISVALNIPASLLLFKVLGIPGIALATTLIHAINCTFLIVVAHSSTCTSPPAPPPSHNGPIGE